MLSCGCFSFCMLQVGFVGICFVFSNVNYNLKDRKISGDWMLKFLLTCSWRQSCLVPGGCLCAGDGGVLANERDEPSCVCTCRRGGVITSWLRKGPTLNIAPPEPLLSQVRWGGGPTAWGLSEGDGAKQGCVC